MFGIQWSESFNQRTRRISGANLIYISLFVATCLLTPIESSRSNKWNLKRGYFRKYPQATRRQEIITELAPTLLNPITSAILPTNQSESNWGSTHFNFPNPVDTLPDFSTFEIQTAIDSLAGKPGVIQFEAGTYLLSSNNSIRLPSFVVLRGESSTPSATVLRVSGPPRNLFEIGDPKASGSLRPEEVQDWSKHRPHRLVTKSWNDAMNMSSLVRNGKPQIWLAPNTAVNQEREITVISGNRIMWEVPLTDSINVALSENTASVVAYQAPVRVQQAGIENLVLTQVPDSSSLVVGTPTILPIKIGGAEDCWISNIQATGFIEFSYLTQPSRRITLSDFVIFEMYRPRMVEQELYPSISPWLDLKLALRGKTIGAENTASYIVSTGRLAAGPNVVSGYIATGSKKHMIEPHQRWSTGFLVEDSHVGQINLKNRGIMGTGHGWAIGSGVVWSCSATKITIENPPMSRKFPSELRSSCQFPKFPTYQSSNPANSLYQMQLSARIGAEAAALVFRPPSPSSTQPSNTAQPTESIPDTVPDAQGQSKSQVPDDLVSGLLGVL
ncbi:hypothetical protein PSTT_05138 [Puccinia striiformis]|uniref:Pectate lyase superfamily protein domain-containing protein n=1 Tax=Puccinia striiformis TaxID=27350 RepID=A0A2S4VPV2_9BASI|nr:hypothetical protein PSTT_05138 [Puccinia striiformis]